MTPETRKKILTAVVILVAIALCVIFPRILSFAGLVSRELRYFWWLILIAALGIYLALFLERKKK